MIITAQSLASAAPSGASITADRLHRLAPLADAQELAVSFDAAAKRFEINTSRRVRHWLAQIAEETGGLRVWEENLSYSAQRLMQVWPHRFADLQIAARCAHAPAALAEVVYGGRMGNSVVGGGWAYRGRGGLQLTGRSAYAKAEVALGEPYLSQPDSVASPPGAALTAAWFFASSGCLARADADDLVGVTRIVNGGLTNLEARRAWLQRAAQIWPDHG